MLCMVLYCLVLFSLLYLIILQIFLTPQNGLMFSKLYCTFFTARVPPMVTTLYKKFALTVFVNHLKEV